MIGNEFWVKVFSDLGLIFTLDYLGGDSEFDYFTSEDEEEEENLTYFFYVESSPGNLVFDSMDDLSESFNSREELFSWLRRNYEIVFNKILETYENK